MKKKINPLLIVLVIISSVIILFYNVIFTSRSEFDAVDKPNDKMIAMFNTAIDRQIDEHTQGIEHVGFIKESRQNAINYLKSIRSIEEYARYGVKSTKARNLIELKIVFNNGKVVDQIYTGQNVSGYMAPSLLMKANFIKGKVVKVYTNGQEKKSSPQSSIPDITLMINKAITYDMIQHRDKYFDSVKKQEEINKEWDAIYPKINYD